MQAGGRGDDRITMCGNLLPCGGSYWLLASGFWLLATGYWLLAAGCWLLAAHCSLEWQRERPQSATHNMGGVLVESTSWDVRYSIYSLLSNENAQSNVGY